MTPIPNYVYTEPVLIEALKEEFELRETSSSGTRTFYLDKQFRTWVEDVQGIMLVA